MNRATLLVFFLALLVFNSNAASYQPVYCTSTRSGSCRSAGVYDTSTSSVAGADEEVVMEYEEVESMMFAPTGGYVPTTIPNMAQPIPTMPAQMPTPLPTTITTPAIDTALQRTIIPTAGGTVPPPSTGTPPFDGNTTTMSPSQAGNIVSDYCYTSCEWFGDGNGAICKDCKYQFIQYAPPGGSKKCYDFPRDLKLLPLGEINLIKAYCASSLIGGCRSCHSNFILNPSGVNLMMNAYLTEAFHQFEIHARDSLHAKIGGFNILATLATQSPVGPFPPMGIPNAAMCVHQIGINRNNIADQMTMALESIKQMYLSHSATATAGTAMMSVSKFKLTLSYRWKETVMGTYRECVNLLLQSSDTAIKGAAEAIVGSGDFALLP